MKGEFLIQRNGKIFVLYAGLLDLAHERGLRDLRVELVQAPSASNSFVAIAKAIATVKQGDTFAIFEEIGDASAANTSAAIAPHIIRMAATRAKARALRDALNIGVTALEELKGDGESATEISDDTPFEGDADRDAPSAPRASSGREATEKQIAYLTTLCTKAKTTPQAMGFDGTMDSASALIESLKGASTWKRG
ncbi:MAG: hypothetical protein EBS00_02110 [Verrucomicrobia bacterium]|nr:hypothetical protein [Verrucomicrobiota bacterium]